jgi:hypothetical protein
VLWSRGGGAARQAVLGGNLSNMSCRCCARQRELVAHREEAIKTATIGRPGDKIPSPGCMRSSMVHAAKMRVCA